MEFLTKLLGIATAVAETTTGAADPAAVTTDSAAGGIVGILFSLLPLLLVFVLMYFMMIRPEKKRRKKEQDMLKDMRMVQEMYARGFEFLPIDIFKANVSKFTIIDGKIMPALTSITGLGEKAAQSMADASQSGEISCVADLEVKTLVGQKMLIELDRLGIFHDLPKSNQLSMFDTLF